MEIGSLRGVPLLLQAPLGTRLVARFKLPDGGLSDALGLLTFRGAESVVITGRRGEITVMFDDVTAAKVVPPAPPRARPGAGSGV